MKELSLNILDIAQNSIVANASLIKIAIDETDDMLKIKVCDNGCGMSPELLQNVTSPFSTTRTTRKVGMGIPLFKMACEQTGGTFSIRSRYSDTFPKFCGTLTSGTFYKNHIDFTPLGDIIGTLITLIQSLGDKNLIFTHTFNFESIKLDTREMRELLGEDIPLNLTDVLTWTREFLNEKYNATKKERT